MKVQGNMKIILLLCLLCLLLILFLVFSAKEKKIESPLEISKVVRENQLPFSEDGNDERRTFNEAIVEMGEKSGVKDLQFYFYRGFQLDQEGRSNDYAIVAYSASLDSLISENHSNAVFSIRKLVDETADQSKVKTLDRIKDTSEIYREAMTMKGDCSGDVDVLISSVQGQPALVMCSDPIWNTKVEYLKY